MARPVLAISGGGALILAAWHLRHCGKAPSPATPDQRALLRADASRG